MKLVSAFVIAFIVTLASVVGVHAQSAESIWLAANTTVYKTQETVIVTVNGVSATPIQGFTFQIRYDPACLRPVNASSTIPGMNGLPLPQLTGLVDGSYASTTPQMVNGVLAEVRFVTLGGCQTNLALESAALAIRNESGFAAPLAGVTIGERNIVLNIDKEIGIPQNNQADSGSILPLDPPSSNNPGISGWLIGLFVMLIVGLMFGAFKLFRIGHTSIQTGSTSSGAVTLHMKRGPQAGKSLVLNQLPCGIGRDPRNEICLNDPHIMGQHARIFASNNEYYLMDLSGNTFINGKAIRNSSTILKPGDVVRLGKSALFVFAA